MSHTKTAVTEALKSPEHDLPSPKLRSPSPPSPANFRAPSVPADSRAPSLAPPSPTSAAARLTSPLPDPVSRATPARERTPALAPTISAVELSVEPKSESKSESKSDADDEAEDVDQEGVIDLDTFNQILDLDEDDTHEFSFGMTEAYFTQASTTFTDMDNAFEGKDLPKLSSLGHFLKGSSAALGVCAVQATCEDIQHYGALRDEETGTDLTEEIALAMIAPLLARVKREYAIAERWLRNWYDENVIPAEV
ncbi:histidine-phosphotransfer domain HPT domain-containing protein [Ganoderma leucocontextum]|nr:histidine-phosphotransfer domain HPT domain-containing protein [Ganoderma leucocontextum]